ncbi:MAG TPA: hypothetical protein VGV40_01855 [Solirubrobacteraceae bacterium]|nr:hypothetical protein [Solirubrobacteraceae bacterium]
MSPLDRELPPVGEEIHLPGGSFQPVAVTVGITLALLGITTSFVFVIVGVLITVVATVRWIRHARHEMSELPLEHH